jgi:hypothetical protein
MNASFLFQKRATRLRLKQGQRQYGVDDGFAAACQKREYRVLSGVCRQACAPLRLPERGIVDRAIAWHNGAASSRAVLAVDVATTVTLFSGVETCV